MQDAVIVDLDGTLAYLNGRDPYQPQFSEQDSVNEDLKKKIIELKGEGYIIIIATGREDRTKNETLAWLKKHDIPFDKILMRPTGNMMNNLEMKKAYLLKKILPEYNVFKAYDDVPEVIKMYQHYGIDAIKV